MGLNRLNIKTWSKRSTELLGKGTPSGWRLASTLYSTPSLIHQPSEAFYHGAVHGLLFSDVASEANSAKGRSDLVLSLPGRVLAVIELKYVPETPKADGDPVEMGRLQKAATTEALGQIEKQGYLGSYLAKSKELLPIGLVIYGRDQVRISFGRPIAGLLK
ncbi:MAG: PD-(D/E)XK nuclease domain-containing protein, partial [Deltaproteobacteria bacterium]|nr:PD-(D/E)XK nuclease domain-containing protein [Deltaproteobacteria bacterium]